MDSGKSLLFGRTGLLYPNIVIVPEKTVGYADTPAYASVIVLPAVRGIEVSLHIAVGIISQVNPVLADTVRVPHILVNGNPVVLQKAEGDVAEVAIKAIQLAVIIVQHKVDIHGSLRHNIF